MTPSRVEGSRRVAFELQGLVRLGIVINGDLVAVLVAALVNDGLHLDRCCLAQRKGLDSQIVALGSERDLGDIPIHEIPLKFLRSGIFVFGREHLRDDRRSRLARNNWCHDRVLCCGPRCCQNPECHQPQNTDPRKGKQFHSMSSVAILKDLRKRTSWGVMVSRVADRLSGSCSMDSWST